jgi:septal ring-binding cell division protein DamX
MFIGVGAGVLAVLVAISFLAWKTKRRRESAKMDMAAEAELEVSLEADFAWNDQADDEVLTGQAPTYDNAATSLWDPTNFSYALTADPLGQLCPFE